jgi:tRNA uridine 5-carboxymethylaminomethyl modification enzyme
LLAELRGRRVFPSAATNGRLAAAGIAPLSKETTAERLLRRPAVGYTQLRQALDLPEAEPTVAALVEATMRYQGYAGRAQPARLPPYPGTTTDGSARR